MNTFAKSAANSSSASVMCLCNPCMQTVHTSAQVFHCLAAYFWQICRVCDWWVLPAWGGQLNPEDPGLSCSHCPHHHRNSGDYDLPHQWGEEKRQPQTAGGFVVSDEWQHEAQSLCLPHVFACLFTLFAHVCIFDLLLFFIFLTGTPNRKRQNWEAVCSSCIGLLSGRVAYSRPTQLPYHHHQPTLYYKSCGFMAPSSGQSILFVAFSTSWDWDWIQLKAALVSSPWSQTDNKAFIYYHLLLNRTLRSAHMSTSCFPWNVLCIEMIHCFF